VAAIAGVIRDSLCARLKSRSLANIRQSMYHRLHQLSLTFDSRADVEGIPDRFSDDLARIESAFSMAASWGILPGLEALLCMGLMCWLDWRVGLLGLLFSPWVLLAPRTVELRAAEAAAVSPGDTARVCLRGFSDTR